MAYLQGKPKCLTFKVRIFVIVKQFYIINIGCCILTSFVFRFFCFPFFWWKITHIFYALFFKFLCRFSDQPGISPKQESKNEWILPHSFNVLIWQFSWMLFIWYVMRAFDDTMKAFHISSFLTTAWADEKKCVSKKSMYSLNSCLLYIIQYK